MSSKMTKKAQGYAYDYKPIEPGQALGSITQFAQQMTDPIMRGVQEQKRRSGTVKKDNFYNNYVIPIVNTLAQLTPTPSIAYTIAAHNEEKKLKNNIRQYQALHANRQFWFKQLEDAYQNNNNKASYLAVSQLLQNSDAIRSNIAHGRQLASDTTGLTTTAGTSALNTIGPGPMLQLYNMFASKRYRVPSFQDPDTHQSLAGMSPDLLQMSRNAVAAKPFANIGNLILYSGLGAGPASQAFRAVPYIGSAPNAIQLAAKPWLPYAQAAQKFGYYTLAGQATRAMAHNMSAAQQRKNKYPAYMLPFLSMIPGAPPVNGPIFSAQIGPQQVRIVNAFRAISAAMQGQPIPKVPKIYAPYVGTHDVISAVPGNMLVSGVPWVHKLDTISNYAQYVPFIAPRSLEPWMPYFRGPYDPSNIVLRLAAGRNSLDSGQQQRNQLAGQKLFKDAHEYIYWPARPVINSALYEPLQKSNNLAVAYADYVRAAAAAGADIKGIPLPSAHWRNGSQVPELEQEQARSVFATYAYTLETPNAFAGIELAQNSKQAAAVRDRYMGQLNLYISMLPDEKIADLALQHQMARNAAALTQGHAPDFRRLWSSPVLANLSLPKSRYQNIISIYRSKLPQPTQRSGK